MVSRMILLCWVVLFTALISSAQYKVHFIIEKLPPYHRPSDTIYLAGNFNSWNPKDEKMRVKTSGPLPGITIELPGGMYEYKFTEGGWDKSEAVNGGHAAANRRLTLESDTVINIDIPDWSQHFPKNDRPGTASKNVHIIDPSFYMPQLNRDRRVWIYLPPHYQVSGKKYPVLYMQDGQNVFDDATSGFGEWGVDEALDTLGQKTREIIVVAVDHGGDSRINEYAPYDMEKFGKGEGDQYVDFLVQTLKPYIDSKYRTKKDAKNTFIAGSSMGGLISFYALLKYPDVFGGAGVFSPSFWIAPQLRHLDPEKAKKVKGKIYFYAGRSESEHMVPDMLTIFEQMRKYSHAKMQTVIRAEGVHSEQAWRKEFPLFYRWLVN